MTRSEFRADINGLRGLSVALVVAYHLQLRAAGGGFIGVDVFFVVSGYLMTRILVQHHGGSPVRYVAFVAARARRIWPALGALIAVLLMAGAVALPPFDLASLSRQSLWALSFASNHFYLDHSGYANRTVDDLWLLHTWSLSVEWQFYLLYPLLLWGLIAAAQRWRPGASTASRRGALAVALAASCAFSLAWQAMQRASASETGLFLLPARAWELMAGGVVFLLGADGAPMAGPDRRVAAFTGIVLILVSALGLALLRLRPVGLDLVLLGPVFGAGLVLWAADVDNPVLRLGWLQAVGRWSYSIYLWHWPIIVAARLTPWPNDLKPWVWVAALALSVLAGGLSYRWIELPVLGRRREGWRGLARPAVALLVVVGLAGVALSTDGLSMRDRGYARAYPDYGASIHPLLFPERCSNFKKAAEAMTVCPIDRAGSARKVLVIGDSHAEHLWPWFVAHSKVSVDFFAASECPPVPAFERLQPGYRCKDYAALAWRKARAAEYDTVIVSARWATVGLAGPAYCHEALGGQCERVPAARKPGLVRQELRAVIERGLRAGKTVVVLDSAPEAGVRVPRHLAREQFWFGAPRLSIDRSAVSAANGWIDTLFEELRAQPGFHLASLRGTLCDDRVCRVYDDTLVRPIYYDESHFDPVWIAENARFLEPFVQRDGPAPSAAPVTTQ